MPQPLRSDRVVDRAACLRSFADNRARTADLFRLLDEDAYYERPIPLRHPVVFYEGHIPAFSINTLLKRGLGRSGLDADLETLFARGIDPGDPQAAARAAVAVWPSKARVCEYVDAADAAVRDALEHAEIERPDHPVLQRGQGVFTLLEHEVLHQETLLYMWHRFPTDRKRRPDGAAAVIGGLPPAPRMIRVPAGRAALGADRSEIPFGWDNEFPSLHVDVPAFDIDVYDVTNQAYLDFVEAGGYRRADLWRPEDWQWRVATGLEHPLFWERQGDRWMWRGMFERRPLPAAWPVYVSHAEAAAYARWKGLRLPTEAEFHRAAYGTPDGRDRDYPWGADEPAPAFGNFGFQRWDPVPVGAHPAGASAWGVEDLVGNGWEWTSTVFDGFPGFEPMAAYPEYSADFFDGQHYVIKGASPATGTGLLRRSFRNWFRFNYPYVYATFRLVRGIA